MFFYDFQGTRALCDGGVKLSNRQPIVRAGVPAPDAGSGAPGELARKFACFTSAIRNRVFTRECTGKTRSRRTTALRAHRGVPDMAPA